MKAAPIESAIAEQRIQTSPVVPATDDAVSYEIEELFFSRTDERGVIQSYNDTFERIAGFEPRELYGAPHKLVRHPEMPKAVFWLLWDGLKTGVPVGAYVRNRTKNGKYYWVYAVASPISGGYLSVRMKPTSGLLQTVKKLYAEAIHREASLNLSAEISAAHLLEELQAINFPTYAMFQSYAFYSEFEARRESLNQSKGEMLRSVDVITSNTEVFQRELSRLARKFDHAILLITNMEIVANKQQAGQSVLREIARNYSLKMRRIQTQLDRFRSKERYQKIWEVSRDQNSYFLLCAAHLMEEMTLQFEKQSRNSDRGSTTTDTKILHELLCKYETQSTDAVVQSVEAANDIIKNTENLRELILTMSNIRIACRVEMARLTDSVTGLAEILASLDEFHNEVDEHLRRILEAAGNIISGVGLSKIEAN